MRVKLVVTGDLERKALGPSLRRYFKESDAGEEVEFPTPRKVHGITTRPLPANGDAVPRVIDGLARAMIAEIWEGADGKPADLVIAIDDLELANRVQPERVASWVRRGIARELDRRATVLGSRSEAALRNRVRERCSFHLLAPMVEAYFFAERSAWRRAGVASDCMPRLVRPHDVEDFETDDPPFLAIARVENERRLALGHHWWQHERHPKHYLEHLCGRDGTIYQETVAGAAALAELRWCSLTTDGAALPFARALFQDLSDFLGVDNPMGACTQEVATYPTRATRRAELILRNL